MARAVVDRAAAREKAGAREKAFAEEQRVKKEAIVRDKRIIKEEWERWSAATEIVDYVPFMVHRVTLHLPKDPYRRKSIESKTHCVIRVEDFEFAAAKIPAVTI